MTEKTPITMARGDGIGPEIMDATLKILEAAGAQLDIEEIEIGEKVYEAGNSAGIEQSSWESLKRTKVFLKAPITTPQGGGYKSLNVTVRKSLGLYSNVRPCVAYHPFVETRHPDMDVVIIRENEEDLYAGIEHQQTQDVVQCLKLITRPGCERIIRYAFEYARLNHRKKVTAFVKDNIMKLSDGMFHDVFKEVSKEYPEIEADHMIVDIGAARLADTPDWFDVIVTLNLYGDIISDIAAQITGSVGLAGSANIGDDFAMFEAIHGSAPPIAGKGIANPSGLLLGAVMMLVHIGQPKVATKIHNAWLRTLEDGVHTAEIFHPTRTRRRVGTADFAQAVIDRLGQEPQTMKKVAYATREKRNTSGIRITVPPRQVKTLLGTDVFIDMKDVTPADLAAKLQPLEGDKMKLDVISSRGLAVWPGGQGEAGLVDHWRCRFKGEDVKPEDLVALLSRINDAGLDFIKCENLYAFDGVEKFSKAQGA